MSGTQKYKPKMAGCRCTPAQREVSGVSGDSTASVCSANGQIFKVLYMNYVLVVPIYRNSYYRSGG